MACTDETHEPFDRRPAFASGRTVVGVGIQAPDRVALGAKGSQSPTFSTSPTPKTSLERNCRGVIQIGLDCCDDREPQTDAARRSASRDQPGCDRRRETYGGNHAREALLIINQQIAGGGPHKNLDAGRTG